MCVQVCLLVGNDVGLELFSKIFLLHIAVVSSLYTLTNKIKALMLLKGKLIRKQILFGRVNAISSHKIMVLVMKKDNKKIYLICDKPNKQLV